ncbi:hypothetical protein PoB_005914800 [Plakobranchus ocellatus]|uniref:Uncharacterized protein n=1 Tax=Plakobranchus ocellatus TaxID=259542 RepID=A0AAV4CLI9_9GAST|nr:hypothetical protein PoB_005914800 [Plakobranchus ocellatus]
MPVSPVHLLARGVRAWTEFVSLLSLEVRIDRIFYRQKKSPIFERSVGGSCLCFGIRAVRSLLSSKLLGIWWEDTGPGLLWGLFGESNRLPRRFAKRPVDCITAQSMT